MLSKNKKQTTAIPPHETAYEQKQREHKAAKELAEKFKHIKPTRYLLK